MSQESSITGVPPQESPQLGLFANPVHPRKVITILRTHFLEDVTLGTIDDNGVPFAQTCELPWKNNLPNVSCIPKGRYVCKPYSSAKYPNTWQIMDVQGRTYVLLHWGNKATDTEGCVIVGEHFGKLRGTVEDSRTTPGEGFLEFLERVKGLDSFDLVIEECHRVH